MWCGGGDGSGKCGGVVRECLFFGVWVGQGGNCTVIVTKMQYLTCDIRIDDVT